MDNKDKPHIKRFHDFELTQKLGRDSIIEAGRTVRVFEASQGMFRLQQMLETARKSQEGVLYGSKLATDLAAVNYAMGVVQTIESVYTMLDIILNEAQEAMNKSE